MSTDTSIDSNLNSPSATYNSAVKAVIYNRVLLILGFLGIFIAGYLSLAHFLQASVACGGSGGCDRVTSDKSSVWFGVPVAYIGLASYIALTALAVVRAQKGVLTSRKLVMLGYPIAAVGAMISIGLQFYSLFVIHEVCKWCMSSAITMTVTLVVYALLAQAVESEHEKETDGKEFFFTTGGAVAALVLLGGGYYQLSHSGPAPTIVSKAVLDKVTLIPTDHANIFGDPSAPITIVEFADLLCPSCQINSPKVKEFVRQHPGKIKVIYRHFPLPVHDLSLATAAISQYAAEKGKFWEYSLAIMATHEEIKDPAKLFEIATNVGLDVADIKKRVQNDNDPIYDLVTRDKNAANALGVQSTPTFFLQVPGKETQVFVANSMMTELESTRMKSLVGG